MADTNTGVEIREDRDGWYFLIEDEGYTARRVVHMKKTEHGYRGFVPSLSGITVQAETQDEVKAQLTQAINAHLATMRG